MKAIITRGLPASGKSTFAKKWVAESPETRAEINRDDLREMLSPGSSFKAPENSLENLVSKIQMAFIDDACDKKQDIIISDTNLIYRFAKNLVEKLVSKGFEVEFKDFIVPVEELIERENIRGKVGSEVIMSKARRHPYESWWDASKLVEKVVSETVFKAVDNNPENIKTVVFDVDGTLATMNGRSPYDLTKVSEDVPNMNVVNLTKMYAENGFKVVVFSGREDKSMDDTVTWLKTHGVVFHEIRMRKTGDVRNDSIVKYEMVVDLVKNHYVEMVFDDRDRVVSMWRQAFAGQPTICAQVNYGDF